MSDEEINPGYSQYSNLELYGFLDQELNSDKKEAILNELSKRLKSSFEDTVSDASKPPVVLPQYRRENISPVDTNSDASKPPVVPPQYKQENVLPIVPTNPNNGNVTRNTQNDDSGIGVIILAVVVGIGMLMAGM
jgi:hypothetical protein